MRKAARNRAAFSVFVRGSSSETVSAARRGSGRGRGQARELVDALADFGGQGRDLFGREVGGAEGVVDLLLAQLREQVADPLRLLDGDGVEESGVLPLVGELHPAALDLLDESGLHVLLRLVAAVRDGAARFAEGRAEVADDVLQLALPAALTGHVDDLVVRVLQVPVVQESHHDDETLKLFRPLERVIVPTPIVEALPTLRPRLEADVCEALTLAALDLLARVRRVDDLDARDEVVNVRHVARGPDQTLRGGLRPRLVAELDDPLLPGGVAHAPLHRVARRVVAVPDDLTEVGLHRLSAGAV